MKPVGRVTQDLAGGLLTGPLVDFVFVNKMPIAVLGTPVVSHGPATHAAATMVEGSTFVKADGIPICIVGHMASCGDALSTGSDNVFCKE